MKKNERNHELFESGDNMIFFEGKKAVYSHAQDRPACPSSQWAILGIIKRANIAITSLSVPDWLSI